MSRRKSMTQAQPDYVYTVLSRNVKDYVSVDIGPWDECYTTVKQAIDEGIEAIRRERAACADEFDAPLPRVVDARNRAYCWVIDDSQHCGETIIILRTKIKHPNA